MHVKCMGDSKMLRVCYIAHRKIRRKMAVRNSVTLHEGKDIDIDRIVGIKILKRIKVKPPVYIHHENEQKQNRRLQDFQLLKDVLYIRYGIE